MSAIGQIGLQGFLRDFPIELHEPQLVHRDRKEVR